MKEKTRTVLFWFILIQPFLDLYWFYNGKLAEVLPFTLPTIIRILAVFVIWARQVVNSIFSPTNFVFDYSLNPRQKF